MKKYLAMALSFVVGAVLAVGGTLAFLTDSEAAVNITTVGRVDVELVELQREDGNDSDLVEFTDGKALVPLVGSAQGEKDKWGLALAETNFVDKIVRVKNTGNEEAYVRVLVAIPMFFNENDPANPAANIIHWNVANRFDPEGEGRFNTGDWKVDSNPFYTDFVSASEPSGYNPNFTTETIDGEQYYMFNFTVKRALNPGETTAAVMTGLYLDSGVDYDDEIGKYIDKNGNVINYDFSNGVKIPVYVQAVQADGFASADAAFNATGMNDAGGLALNPWAGVTLDVPEIVETEEELADAIEDGKDVILTGNVEVAESQISIPADSEVTINLNGNDIIAASEATATHGVFNIPSGSTLNIEGDGEITFSANINKGISVCLFQNDGELNIYGGTYSVEHENSLAGLGAVVSVVDNCVYGGESVVNIYGGTFSVSGQGAVNLMRNWPIKDATATINIYGGTFNANPDRTTTYIWNKNDTNIANARGYVNIYGGEFNGNIVVEVDGYRSSAYVADGIDVEIVEGSITGYVD